MISLVSEVMPPGSKIIFLERKPESAKMYERNQAMGKILAQYYDFAKNKGAYTLRMRLAMLTGWTTAQIHTLEDSKANITRVRNALKQLMKTNDIPHLENQKLNH